MEVNRSVEDVQRNEGEKTNMNIPVKEDEK
jgi:hypothetical protein